MNIFDQADDISINRFDTVTEFLSHIEFARKLLEKYEWDEENAKKFTAELDAL